MNEIIECYRCYIETEFEKWEYDTFEHEGKTYKLKKPILKCPNCGEQYAGDEVLA